MQKRCNKVSCEAGDHVGPVSYWQAEATSEGTLVSEVCQHCGNTVVLRLAPGQPCPKLGAYQPIIDPPQKD